MRKGGRCPPHLSDQNLIRLILHSWSPVGVPPRIWLNSHTENLCEK